MMKKFIFVLGIALIIISCADHSTMVEVEDDSSSSTIKLSSSAFGLSSSNNFSSESLHSSSSIKLSSSAILSSSSITQSSSSVVFSSSSSSIEYGSITYEGQTYKTVKIGTQTWMAENLNYTVDSSWCFNNSADSCAKYGRLYLWASAMDIDSAYNSKTWGGSDVNHQGICPSDWHLPNYDEWQTLYDYVDTNNGDEGVGTSLKSTSGWTSNGNGSDLFGFSALPGGGRSDYGSFYDASEMVTFWSATEYGSGSAHNWDLYYNYVGYWYRDYAFSVRCLKN